MRGVSIERKISNQTKSNIEETEDSLNILFFDEEDTNIKIGVNFEKILSRKGNFTGNLLLKPNDVIFFPKKDSTVSVLGAVQRETAMPYANGISFREAVIKAGGAKQLANYKNAYVIYQNGDVKGTKRFLFFNIRPRLEPGAVVVVPVKDEKRVVSAQEVIGMTSALVSLTLLVRTIIGN